MIVLDASVLVAFFRPSDAHAVRARKLVASADEQLGLSVMTMAELLAGRDGETERHVLDLEPVIVPIGADAGARLGQLRRTTRLKLPDCCVLLAAEAVGARAVATFDERLARAARERGLRVP